MKRNRSGACIASEIKRKVVAEPESLVFCTIKSKLLTDIAARDIAASYLKWFFWHMRHSREDSFF